MAAQSIYTQTLVKNLEKWRTIHSYSQADFAQAIGMSKTNYSRLVSGEVATINADVIYNVYKVTGYLCFELMEIYTDDFLKIMAKLHQFSRQELHFMNEFVDVYQESKRREKNDD